MNKSEIITSYLNAFARKDLASLYSIEMECQVNVARDNGEPISGEYKGKKWKAWTDGTEEWKSFRIPFNAATKPTYEDGTIKWNFDKHVEAIGMTGWNWTKLCSQWVAYDFDAIVGHSDIHSKKLSDEELNKIIELLTAIPWVQVRRSASGKGLHVYVYLMPYIKTENHHEHAALARAILSQLGAACCFDFKSKVDICIPKDTWVQTKDGPRLVSEIINKDCEIVVNGKSYHTKGFFRTKEELTYCLTTTEGYKVESTDNHPYLVDYDGLQFWKELKDITVGDKIVLNEHKNLSWDGDGDWKDGYILGWLYGDGYFRDEKARNNLNSLHGLLFFKDDFQIMKMVETILPDCHKCWMEPNYCYKLWSPYLDELRVRFGLDTKKVINNLLEMASSDFYSGFISAFFDSDGSADKDHCHVSLTQSDLPRLEAIQRMLLRLGIVSHLNLEHGPGVHRFQNREKLSNVKAKYSLTIGRENVLIFNERVGFKHERKKQINLDNINKIIGRTKGKKILAKQKFIATVKSIVPVEIKEVYDINVPGINAFDANGIMVHNCGGNMWVWHRKGINTNGFEVIKDKTEYLEEVPINWRDHIQVVKGIKKRITPDFVVKNQEDTFEQLCGQNLKIELDEDHKKLLDYLRTKDNGSSWWDTDRHMLVTHTIFLAEAHRDLMMRGVFATASKGSERGNDHNTYLFPLRKGAWSCRRFSQGCNEHPSWKQDKAGWTTCFLNKEPDLATASRAMGGVDLGDGKGYQFRELEVAVKAAEALGAKIEIPAMVATRETILKETKDGKLILEIEHAKQDSSEKMVGWANMKTKWRKVVETNGTDTHEVETPVCDDIVRHVVTEIERASCGWYVNSEGYWIKGSLELVRPFLKSYGHNPGLIEPIIGLAIQRSWREVNRPFENEYVGNRDWNKKGAKLRYVPNPDKENLKYPHWMKILTHVGSGLNEALKNNKWAQDNGITTGADYLKCWIASLFQKPYEPLPYLFLFGPQDCGKSILYEGLRLLFDRGHIEANTALLSQSDFNGELANAVLCFIEEVDLSKAKFAYNRIKNWVTSKVITIHEKNKTPYQLPNSTHWIQCVPKTTWIMTEEGPKQVKELINKDCTIIQDSSKYKTNGFFYTGYKDVYKVETVQGYSFESTDNHLVKTTLDGIEYWSEVKYLKQGSTICLNKHLDVHWGGDGNYNQGYILGWLFGDGTTCKIGNGEIRNTLYFYKNDLTLFNWFLTLFKEQPNYLIRDDNAHTIACPELNRLCEEFNVYGEKVINTFIEESSSDFLSGFISAFFDTDGSVINSYRRKAITLSQSDLLRLKVIQRILLRFGVYSSISPCNRKKNIYKICSNKDSTVAKESFVLTIRKLDNFKIFSERIGFRLLDKNQKLKILLGSWSRKDIKEEYTTEVKTITYVGKEDVYDITVPEVHAFSGNGFVLHNCSNNHTFCPMFTGDTRITMISVSALSKIETIPKHKMLTLLEKEAPDFLASVLSLEIPDSESRLSIPIITTAEKINLENINQPVVDKFVKEMCFDAPGTLTLYGELYDKFIIWLPPELKSEYTKTRFGKEFPSKYPRGYYTANKTYVGNISMTTNFKISEPWSLDENGKLTVGVTSKDGNQPKGVTNG